MGGARLITDLIHELEKGRYLADASVALQELVAQVEAAGKGGRLTLTLDIKPNSADGETVTVNGAFAVKAPALPRAGTLFFVSGDNNLTRRDPRQHDIEDRIRAVDGAADAAN